MAGKTTGSGGPEAPKINARVLIIEGRFYEDLADEMAAGAIAELKAHGAKYERMAVPGALEIPVVLQTMAHTQKYDALIAIGVVIRGDTYHFEVVSNESCRGVMDVTLETGMPIANGILTVDTDAQAMARIIEKGTDCARAAIEMAHLTKTISAPAKERT